MKRLSILGSTGSIGTSTLDLVAAFPHAFSVRGLVAGRNVDLLEQQVRRFLPACVAVADRERAAELERRVGRLTSVRHGVEGFVEVATLGDVDLVVSAVVGAAGLEPTWEALRAGRNVALANKEALVLAGQHMIAAAREGGCVILPVDSEHNALHQCLRGERVEEVRRLWLTASGGPFRAFSRQELQSVTPEQALQHPTWKMGRKITVDSATLMNKGLEVIEAHWLFDVVADRIEVVVHPQSVVHSMVEFVDGSFKAQLGVTDMRHPIQYALCWPDRGSSVLPPFDPVSAGPLEFERPDLERFPCLDLAYSALRAGGAAPAVLNAANEIAVEAFLERRISFPEIPALISAALERHGSLPSRTLGDLRAADATARRTAIDAVSRAGAR